MPVLVRCPKCKKNYDVPAAHLGKQARCKQCGTTFTAAEATKTEVELPQATIIANDDESQIHEISPPSPSSASSAATVRVGRFQLGRRLGRGAFGEVFLALDPVLQREVALKLPLARTIESPEARARLEREPRAAAQLFHPNIVPIFDAGFEGDQFYIASAFVEGETLDHAIDGKPMDAVNGATIIRKLAEALDYAHRQGIVHRDVKPANVILDKREEPHLLDFGLAQWHRPNDAQQTAEGTLMGTPAYMSPEQAGAPVGAVGPASDQFALGVMLYELLCGARPFDGPPAAVLYQIREKEPPPLHERVPNLPRDLEAICAKAMAKRPEDRYPNCAALGIDLHRWIRDEPVAARPLDLRERAKRWCKKQPLLAGSMAAAIVLLIVSSILGVSFALYQSETVTALEEKDAATQAQREHAEQQRKLAEERTAEAERQKEIIRTHSAESERLRLLAEQRLRDLETQTQLVASKTTEVGQMKTAATQLEREAEENRKLAADRLETLAQQAAASVQSRLAMARLSTSNGDANSAVVYYASAIRNAPQAADPKTTLAMQTEFKAAAGRVIELEARCAVRSALDHLEYSSEGSAVIGRDTSPALGLEMSMVWRSGAKSTALEHVPLKQWFELPTTNGVLGRSIDVGGTRNIIAHIGNNVQVTHSSRTPPVVQFSAPRVPTAAALSHDSKTLLVACGPILYFVDASTGQALGSSIKTGLDDVRSAAFSNNPHRFVTYSATSQQTGELRKWRRNVVERVLHIPLPSDAVKLMFCSDDKLCVGTQTRGFFIVDPYSGMVVKKFAENETVTGIAISPDKELILVATNGTKVDNVRRHRFYTISTDTLQMARAAKSFADDRFNYEDVTGIGINSYGKLVASAGSYLAVYDWRSNSEQIRPHPPTRDLLLIGTDREPVVQHFTAWQFQYTSLSGATVPDQKKPAYMEIENRPNVVTRDLEFALNETGTKYDLGSSPDTCDRPTGFGPILPVLGGVIGVATDSDHNRIIAVKVGASGSQRASLGTVNVFDLSKKLPLGDPITCRDFDLSFDGKLLAYVDSFGKAQVHTIAAPADIPDDYVTWSEAVTGMTLNDKAELQSLSIEEWTKRRDLLELIANSKADAPPISK